MEVIGRGERVQLGMYQGKEARKNLFREKSALCSLGGGRNRCCFVLFFFQTGVEKRMEDNGID